jgi:methylmalonyl-CoA mutase N-terminal domain/subunit
VNAYTEGGVEAPPVLSIDPDVERRQRERLAAVKASRRADAVEATLGRLRAEAADPSVNLMPAIVEAVRAQATVGEVMGALADVFGTWTEPRQV